MQRVYGQPKRHTNTPVLKNPSSLQILQVQYGWDLNYSIKIIVGSVPPTVPLCWKNVPIPFCIIVGEEAPLPQYLIPLCIKSNQIETKTTVGLSFYILRKTNVPRRTGLLRLDPLKSHKCEIYKCFHLHVFPFIYDFPWNFLSCWWPQTTNK